MTEGERGSCDYRAEPKGQIICLKCSMSFRTACSLSRFATAPSEREPNRCGGDKGHFLKLTTLPQGLRSRGTGVNGLPGAAQSRALTEPQRDLAAAVSRKADDG